jgi:asparaginyl-tRNA synthetase
MKETKAETKEFQSVETAVKKKKGSFKLRGWIKRKRSISGNIFLVLRDATEIIQCVIEEKAVSKDDWAKANKALVESAITLQGTLKTDKRAPHGVELRVKKFDVVSFADDFPIRRDFSEDFLLSVRHLWLRSAKLSNALKIRDAVTNALHEFFQKKGYLQVEGPMFVTGAVEGGATLFEVPYFGNKIYLTQSSQFYLEAFIYGLEKVYTLAPSFRAEKSRTRRHVTEFWHLEMEAAWMQFAELLDFTEDMIKYVVKYVLKNHKTELRTLGRDPKDLELVVKKKFPRYTYDEIHKLALKKFPKLPHGSDLGEKEEREITKDFKLPVIVTHYPAKIKPFYHRPDPKNKDVVLCADILAPEGYGEIVGSGERTWEVKELEDRLKASGLDPKLYGWYVDLRKYGSVPHSGFGLGIERLTAWLCKMPHIRDVIAFPRTMNRYYP